MEVIFEASKEIRSPMVNATLIVIIVFVPLFFLAGVAYVVAVFCLGRVSVGQRTIWVVALLVRVIVLTATPSAAVVWLIIVILLSGFASLLPSLRAMRVTTSEALAWE